MVWLKKNLLIIIKNFEPCKEINQKHNQIKISVKNEKVK